MEPETAITLMEPAYAILTDIWLVITATNLVISNPARKEHMALPLKEKEDVRLAP